MSARNNINFESYISNVKFKDFKNSNKKKFYNSILKTKEGIKENKNALHSLSKNFKLNLNLRELKKYKKFERIITIGFGGSILGTQAINYFWNGEDFLKKLIPKKLLQK